LQHAAIATALCLSLSLVLSARRPVDRESDAPKIETVHTIFVEPITPASQFSGQFQAILKSELVHNGYAITSKPDNVDAILTIELIIVDEKTNFEAQTISKLEGPGENIFWTASYNKTGTDKMKVVADSARKIANQIKVEKDAAIAKKEQKERKE
jgi:hypothetical protein